MMPTRWANLTILVGVEGVEDAFQGLVLMESEIHDPPRTRDKSLDIDSELIFLYFSDDFGMSGQWDATQRFELRMQGVELSAREIRSQLQFGDILSHYRAYSFFFLVGL